MHTVGVCITFEVFSVSTRITVTLPSEVYSIVCDHAAVQGVSISSVIRDYIAEAAPYMARITDAVKSVSDMSAEHRADYLASLSGVGLDLEAALGRADTALRVVK